MPYIVFHTKKTEEIIPNKTSNGSIYTDHYIICGDNEPVAEYLQKLEQRSDVWCCGVAKIKAGSEPQWLDPNF